MDISIGGSIIFICLVWALIRWIMKPDSVDRDKHRHHGMW